MTNSYTVSSNNDYLSFRKNALRGIMAKSKNALRGIMAKSKNALEGHYGEKQKCTGGALLLEIDYRIGG